jgi:flavodoxin
MKRAVIVYRSRTGTTRRLAEEIGRFLASRDIEPRVVSVDDCDV